MSERVLPVTIVTGFLGSGKTTLLGYWLGHPDFQHTAVIVNEFGKVGLDHRVLRRIEENTILLGGGCACCNVRADLVKELANLINARDRGELEVDRVVIETSGLADPAPILFSIMTDSMIRHHYRVDYVVTCLDGVNGLLHLDGSAESIKQIAVADRVILTKTDIADPKVLARLEGRIQAINPAATVLWAACGQIEPEEVFAKETAARPERRKLPLPDQGHDHGSHTTQVHSISIGFTEPLNWAAFGLWLSALLYAHGENIFRVKGLIDTGAEGPVMLNGVQHIIHPPQHLDSWGEEERRSEIVFIMRDIEPRRVLESLRAFQSIIGATARIEELNLDPYGSR